MLLRGANLNATLNILNKYLNLVELDLSSAKNILWINETVLGQLVRPEASSLSEIGMTPGQPEKCIDFFIFLNFTLDTLFDLKYLNLSGNQLSHLNEESCLRTRFLVSVDLSRNRFAEFGERLFKGFELFGLFEIGFKLG